MALSYGHPFPQTRMAQLFCALATLIGAVWNAGTRSPLPAYAARDVRPVWDAALLLALFRVSYAMSGTDVKYRATSVAVSGSDIGIAY
eukprot:749462-Rhodomonas_salina.2